jgi:dTDP-4-dehydrorhamnose 3,5-epimerase
MGDWRELPLEGVYELTPRKIGDERGFFSETYKVDELRRMGLHKEFVQDNHSFSKARGVLRGMHYQLPPHGQAKLVRVVQGSIYDVVIDVRKGSRTFGRWTALHLSREAWNQLYVPIGFAHGFVTLEENTEVIYKVTAPYAPECERAIRYDDPALGIRWPVDLSSVTVSSKDAAAPRLADQHELL